MCGVHYTNLAFFLLLYRLNTWCTFGYLGEYGKIQNLHLHLFLTLAFLTTNVFKKRGLLNVAFGFDVKPLAPRILVGMMDHIIDHKPIVSSVQRVYFFFPEKFDLTALNKIKTILFK